MRIYLDTNLWNISCDQNVDPTECLELLDREGATPVLGIHVIFELAKTFVGSIHSQTRGKLLFTHLKAYLDSGLRCVAKEPSECVAAEMWALKGPVGAEKFLPPDDLAKVTDEITRLASGEFKTEWLAHIAQKASGSAHDRERTRLEVSDRPNVLRKLRQISPSLLAGWLNRATSHVDALPLLTGRLCGIFPEGDPVHLREYARALLAKQCAVSVATVKADLYYNWRCAHRGSNPPDLLDDMYHVLNAAYCDVYASNDKKQLEYATLLLGPRTGVSIYPRERSLQDWLVQTARRGLAGYPTLGALLRLTWVFGPPQTSHQPPNAILYPA